MDDIVKRLRAEDPECGLRHSLAMEAADEIERLRVWLESGGGRYWEGRYRDEAAMVDKLQAALLKIVEEDLQTTRHSDGSRGETIFDGYFGGIARAALDGEVD
jgi:hypothetical protein